MQIGAMNHPARDPLEEIEWIGKKGFDFVDFTLEPPAADPGQIDPKAIRAALDRHGLGVVAHTAWFIPIGSPFGSVREASLAEFRRALRAAQQIGAAVMNVHYGKSPGFFSKEEVPGVVAHTAWLMADGVPSGFAELDKRIEGESELVHFGLMSEFIVQGLGRYLLQWTIDRAWSYRPKRFWLHTCTKAHPAALPNYLKAGFAICKEELKDQE
jgi:GNAT superfamily N-acetyltransferase